MNMTVIAGPLHIQVPFAERIKKDVGIPTLAVSVNCMTHQLVSAAVSNYRKQPISSSRFGSLPVPKHPNQS
jgi:hypothetical protein